MGTAQELQRWQRILLFIFVAALLGSGFVGCGLIQQAREANQAVSYAHAERVIEADALQLALYQRSTSSRGYLIAGDRALLEARNAARVEIDRQLTRLREQGIEPQIIADIDALLTRHDEAANHAATMYDSSPEQARVIWERESKPVHDQLARLIGELATHVGDEVLKRVATSLVGSLRRSDAVGRWGGEEIVVLLPSTDEQGAWRALEHALIDVRKLAFTGEDDATFHVTFSAGAVVVGASESLEEAVARADVLLYKAKGKGRNRVEIEA